MYLSCFKYIRNVYDSVKILSDVMSFISALGWSDRSKRVLAGVDRSDRSVAATLLLCLLVCVT